MLATDSYTLKMEGTLELQRRAHEEIDRLEQAIVNEFLVPENTLKGRLRQELTVSALLDQISLTSAQLLSLYADEDASRQADIDAKSISQGEFGNFYTHLKEVKDFHRRTPGDRPIDGIEFQALVHSCRLTDDVFDALFSGEESWGRFLDLVSYYDRYINLKGVRNLDYLQYLEEFDNFEAIPIATRQSATYAKYVADLEGYFRSFFARAKPLLNAAGLREATILEFEGNYKDESNNKDAIWCGPCQKNFNNSNVYQAHLSGKRHSKAAADYKSKDNFSDTSPPPPPVQTEASSKKEIALNETLVSKYAEVLSETLQDTRTNVERKQSRTVAEREEDAEFDEAAIIEEETTADGTGESGNDAIYNPLNLPLDWDGKPIPYWLWKLHGLGVRYPCEICGNHVYMGRKAFDQHFFVPISTLVDF